MKTTSAVCIIATAVVLAVGQAHAIVTDFTAGEGYTNGNLHGQVNWVTAWPSNSPNGFVVDTLATGYNGALGTVSMSSNWAFWAEEALVEERGDTAVVKAVFRYDAIERIPSNENHGQLLTIQFLGSSNIVRCTLRRSEHRDSDSNRSRMSFQIAANGAGGLPAIAIDEHYEEYTGVSTTGVGLSDWLEYTVTLMRGTSRLDWKMEATVRNLVTGEVCITGRWTVRTSSAFYNDNSLVALIAGQDDDRVHIVAGSREIDSFEIDSFHQDINYDEVCDGNIDGAKSKVEETSTSAVTGNWTIDGNDPWYEWEYLGGSTFIGSVGHDKYGKFGSHKDTDAAVTQTGRKWTPGLPRAVAVDETLEWSVNYRMTAAPGLVEQPHLDLYLTTQPLTITGSPAPSTKFAYAINQVAAVVDTNEYLKMLGVRISQDDATGDGSWTDGSMAIQLRPALNYSGIGSSNNITGWINLNDLGISSGDPEGDHLKVTYRAKKTGTNDVWDCSVTIANRETDASWTFSEEGVTNALLYNATTDIYPTVYDPKGFSSGSDGFEIDDLICRILYVPAPFVSEVIVFDGTAVGATVEGNGTVASLEYVALEDLAAGSWTNVPGSEFTNDTPDVVTNAWPVSLTTDDRAYRVNSE